MSEATTAAESKRLGIQSVRFTADPSRVLFVSAAGKYTQKVSNQVVATQNKCHSAVFLSMKGRREDGEAERRLRSCCLIDKGELCFAR